MVQSSGNSSCKIDAIKARFARIEEVTNADVVITELGGTIGDIEFSGRRTKNEPRLAVPSCHGRR